MELIDSNLYPQAAVMIHNGVKISEERKNELKAIFLEGLIRFLDIYAQTEIGEGVQIDIAKVALHVNSPVFENEDLYSYNSVEDIFRLCENLVISGLPIWRFLRLTEYQSNMFEVEYEKSLLDMKNSIIKCKPCYGCIWLGTINTQFGTLYRCNKPVYSWDTKRSSVDPDDISKCKWLTTLDTIPKAVEELKNEDSFMKCSKSQFLESVEPAREKFRKNLLQDSFRIPKELSSKEIVKLDEKYDALDDLGLAFNNKRTYSERKSELRRAMYIEGMIRFFEMFAKCEIGSNYIADIKNISLYVGKLEDSEIGFIVTFEDVYKDLEEKICNGFDVKKFVKFDDE